MGTAVQEAPGSARRGAASVGQSGRTPEALTADLLWAPTAVCMTDNPFKSAKDLTPLTALLSHPV